MERAELIEWLTIRGVPEEDIEFWVEQYGDLSEAELDDLYELMHGGMA